MSAAQHIERIDRWINELEHERKQNARVETLKRSIERLFDVMSKRQEEYRKLKGTTYRPFR